MNSEVTASIEKEYFYLQSEIEKFDSKSLTIKAWSISVASILAGSSTFAADYTVLLFASLLCLMFWLIDTSWKTFQYANYKRLNEIESYMKGNLSNIDYLQITTSWSESYKQGGLFRFLRIMFWSHVFLPHGAMFIIISSVYFIKEVYIG